MTGVVQGLVGHACSQRPIANHRNHLVTQSFPVARQRQPQRRGQRVARVAGDVGIVTALGRIGETGQATVLPQRMEGLVTAGEQLVGVRLVPHIPQNAVVGGIERPVQRDGELDCAEAGGKVSPGVLDRIDYSASQLNTKLLHAIRIEVSHVVHQNSGYYAITSGPICASPSQLLVRKWIA